MFKTRSRMAIIAAALASLGAGAAQFFNSAYSSLRGRRGNNPNAKASRDHKKTSVAQAKRQARKERNRKRPKEVARTKRRKQRRHDRKKAKRAADQARSCG